ncbi:LOW QUALITY PROTEIN: uncharacterized protein LOC120261383 [Dioscorea cayenensis subsp. rotundata]|uniref:LOW QUALITY PROTEIN: uncharacterized protein LOC120261383 n=1 Tax=Dioscorea cayennensis subsp. rotundata TaxID=55577 RepID=A0AB40BD04_DIOCR|nr:LOW QUALITY PROTEIN: uncharacterized protein LOC120261383 [Dioscorea cayenensis subsp. rotundata]
MIPVRAFSRAHLVWKSVFWPNPLSAPACYFQTGRTKPDPNTMDDRKKRKSSVLPVWRPVSTKSGTTASKVENLPKDLGCGSGSGFDLELKEEVMEETLIVQGSELTNEVGKVSASIPVEASLIRFVNGKGESTRRQIEEETGVKLILPFASSEDTCVVIEGNSIESVNKAAAKIKSVIEEAIKSPSLDYSHFISLPLAIHPELVDKLHSFQNTILGYSGLTFHGNSDNDPEGNSSDDKDDVDEQLENQNVEVKLEVQDNREHVRVQIDAPLANYDATEKSRLQILSDLGIDSSIFIKPKTFHLTVLMLKLWNKERIAAATEVLQNISSKVYDALENRPVSVRLKGLECMRGSPAKARVVYAPVEEIGGEGRLLRACQVIIKAYKEAGLVLDKDAQQPPKLHATLMNARHRKWSLKKKKKYKGSDSFDARGVFLRFGSENWGDYLIREAHLSQRFKFSETGYYHCCTSIPFPETMQVD